MVAVPAATAVTTPELLTVAMDELFVAHVNVVGEIVDPAESFAVATSVDVEPITSDETDVGAIVIVAITWTGTITVTDAEPVIPPAAALMVVVPAATAVTTPELLTVATDELFVVHVNEVEIVVPAESFAVATSVDVDPTARDPIDVGARVTVAITGAAAGTVTDTLVVMPPAVAVIEVVPAATAVTTPELLTVATDELFVAQTNAVVTTMLLAVLAVATSVVVAPIARDETDVGAIEIVAITGAADGTVTEADPERPPGAVATIDTVPGEIPVTVPVLFTVTLDVLLEVHVNGVNTVAPFDSFAVAVSDDVAPTFSAAIDVGDSVTVAMTGFETATVFAAAVDA
jgi:hypothetical protein